MIVRAKSPTIEAYQVNDDQLPALIRRLGGHMSLYVHDRQITIDDPRMSPAREGDYVVFNGNLIEVWDAITFNEKYEEVPEDYHFHSKRLPVADRWNETSPQGDIRDNSESPFNW